MLLRSQGFLRLGEHVVEHVGDEGQGRVARREGRHHLAGVRLDAQAVHARHDEPLARRDEAHDADHSEAAVVDLRLERLGLPLLGHLAREAERVPQVERHRVDGRRDAVLEGGEVAGLAALHVVRLPVRRERLVVLSPALQEADRAEDLQLGRRRQRIPLVGGAAGGGDVRVGDARAGQRPREVDAVRLHDVADEGGHRDAAVLDLGVAEEANRGRLVEDAALVAVAHLREAERIPEADHRVQVLGERLQVGDRLHGGRDRARSLGRHEPSTVQTEGSRSEREHLCASEKGSEKGRRHRNSRWLA